MCTLCGTEIMIYPSRLATRKFCSNKCKRLLFVPWGKGRTKDNDPTLKRLAAEHSVRMKKKFKNKKQWNKGLTKKSDSRIAAAAIKQTKWHNTPSPARDTWKKSMSKRRIAGWRSTSFTKPERFTWDYLINQGYVVKSYSDKSDNDPKGTWYHQYPFFDTFISDFACPDQQCIIEADGCAYHGHDPSKCKRYEAKYGWPKFAEVNIKRDRKKHWFYHSKGWKWANVWECESERGDFHRIEKYIF